MHSVGETRTEEEIDALIKAADGDGDGTMNYAEFARLMLG